MKPLFAAFRQFLRAIWQDTMLAVCLFAPIMIALVFRFGVPALNALLGDLTGTAGILTPYYGLFDMFLSMMTPMMLAFSGVMVMLEELDDGTAKYLMVTPLRASGYLASRLMVLAVASILYNIVLLAIFSLSGISLLYNVLAAFINALVGISIAMLVVGFAKNKVEGMALVKMSGFFVLGYVAAYFLARPLAYLAGVLPGFWLSLMVQDDHAIWALPAVLVACGWIAQLYRRFRLRVLG